MTATTVEMTSPAASRQRNQLYSVLWLFNGREEWEDYYGTRDGLRCWIRSTLQQDMADAVIRIEDGEGEPMGRFDGHPVH